MSQTICECGHSKALHQDGAGCLAESGKYKKISKVCKCEKQRNDFPNHKMVPMEKTFGIK